MGLDMYLYAKRYMGKYTDEVMAKKVRKLFKEIQDTGNLESVEVKFEVGYWRKANAIHKWFVDKCQDGKDECQYSDVSREQLKELKENCEKCLNAKSKTKKAGEKILPTQGGFFFGNTEYDEGYYTDLQDTIKIIDYCLSLPKEYEFVYHSSW